MNGGCLIQFIKIILFTMLGGFLLSGLCMNLGMILGPMISYFIPENTKLGKDLSGVSIPIKIGVTGIGISIWIIAYKLKLFKNALWVLGSVSLITIVGMTALQLLAYVIEIKYAGIGMYVFSLPVILALVLLAIDMLTKEKKDIKSGFIKQKEIGEGFNFKTEYGIINLKNPFRGIYIQGGAGSGKSASIFEPIIKQIAEQKFAGILYDFKSPELTNKIRYSYSDSDIKVRNVDFKHPYTSDRINPIAPEYLNKSVVAIEYSQAFVNNLIPESIKRSDFWSSNAKMIIAGVIWWLKEEHPKYCTIPHVISLLLHTDIKLLLRKISENYEAGGMIRTLRQAIENEAQNQVAGVLSTIQTAVSTLNTKDVFWILSGNDINLNLNDKNEPSFLCLGNDSTLPKVYTPIISMIISVAIRQMNRPGGQQSVILLDEAPTIYIPGIEQIPATARSNKIATIFGVQDYSQLVDSYGQDKAQIILSNLGNQFFGRVTNGKTADMIKTLFSKEDRTFINKSTARGTSGKFVHLQSNKNTGASESIQERDRVKVNDLIGLDTGEFLGVIAEGSPKEFLKTKFIYEEMPVTNYEGKTVTDEELSDNYFKIIEEAKALLTS